MQGHRVGRTVSSRRALVDLCSFLIRTGLTESGAFELAYNIFGGKRVPVFFAIWRVQAETREELRAGGMAVLGVLECQSCRTSRVVMIHVPAGAGVNTKNAAGILSGNAL